MPSIESGDLRDVVFGKLFSNFQWNHDQKLTQKLKVLGKFGEFEINQELELS